MEVLGHNGSWKKATGIFTLNENYFINNGAVFTNKNNYHLYRRTNGKWIIARTEDMMKGASRGCIASIGAAETPINLTWKTRRGQDDELIKVRKT
uniref:Uncharacterized protein n=1 Tax=viral metagenome TaxID=1070528 RepID=A0A6C0B4D2_9ZZZZ